MKKLSGSVYGGSAYDRSPDKKAYFGYDPSTKVKAANVRRSKSGFKSKNNSYNKWAETGTAEKRNKRDINLGRLNLNHL